MPFIRSATPHDLSALNTLVNAAYRGDSSKQGWTTEAHLLDGQRTDSDKLLEMISEPNSTVELAFDSPSETQLLGCVYLKRESDTLYLGMLSVSPTLQSKGLGKELLAHAETVARSHQCHQIRMTVIHARSELIAYYERRGYVLTGKTEPFPQNDPRFGIPKSLFHFVEMMKSLN